MERSRYLGLAGGLTGGTMAWLLWQARADLGSFVTSYGPLDLLAMTVLGAAIGGAARAATARLDQRRLAQAGRGAALGAASAAGASVIALLLIDIAGVGHSAGGFLAARILLWIFTAGGLTLALAIAQGAREPVVLGRALAAAIGSAVGTALMLSLPGPSAVYQLAGCMLVGGVVGLVAAQPDAGWAGAAS